MYFKLLSFGLTRIIQLFSQNNLWRKFILPFLNSSSPTMKTSSKIILGLSITLMAGYTWSLDMPLALEVPLRQDPFNFSSFDFSLLYFATYIPVCFFDISIGMLLDKLSLKKTAIWITTICLLSEIGILLMFSFRFQGYKVGLYVLRGVFGATGSGLFTVQALLITQYGGKYYDTLIGIGVCIPFFFDSLNNIVTPFIYDSTTSMQLVWSVGVGFCFLAFFSSIIISRLVGREERRNESRQEIGISQQKDGSFSFNGLKTMSRQFWIIIGAILFFQLCIATYIDNLNDTLVKRFHFSYVTAGYFLFIPYGMAALSSFIIGKLLERNPKRKRKIILFGAILFSLGILISYLLPNIDQGHQTPVYYYVIVGLQFLTISLMMSVLYGCLSSSIKYVVDEKHLGIGWGVIGSTVGLAEAIGPIIAAFVLETTDNLADGYKRLSLAVFLISLVAIEFAVWIYFGQFHHIDINSSEHLPNTNLEDSLLDKNQSSKTSIACTEDQMCK